MAVQKAQQEVPTHRVNAKANTTRAGSHPMMNAVGGTTLHYWAQSWRLNPWDFKVVSETTRRYGASRIPKDRPSKTGRSGSKSSSRTTTRSNTRCGVSGQAGNIKGTIDPARQHLRRSAQSRVSDAAAAQHRLHRPDDVGGARARLASVPRSRLDQLAQLPEPLGVHVSRLLQQGRLSRRREERPAPDDDSARAGDRPAQSRDARARHVDRRRRQRTRHRRHLRHRRPGILPAGEGRAARELHLRELAAAAAVEVEGVSRTGCRTITARSAATT